MNDPTRWNKDPLRRPSAADLLLRGVRRPRLPRQDDLARLESVIAQIPRRSALAARRWSRFVTAAAAALVVASLGTTVWALRGRRPPTAEAGPVSLATEVAPPARKLSTLAATSVAPAPPSGSPAGDVPEMKAVTPRRGVRAPVVHRAQPATPTAVAAGDVDTLTREIALVDAARADVSAAPARALAALDLHRREFPRGQLAAEREFLAVEALRRSDRSDEARHRADQLQSSYPSSSYAARAARLLQSAP